MPLPDIGFWSDLLGHTLRRYDSALVRQVAGQLVKPRGQWPDEELIDRCQKVVTNPAVIDRRLADLSPAARRLLAVIGHSRQPRWKLGNLLEILTALDTAEGLPTALELFVEGLLYPDLGPGTERLKSFQQWINQASSSGFPVFAHPQVTERARGADLGLPALPADPLAGAAVLEADGLEWPLRLAVLWQSVLGDPLRQTQQGEFFKRDFERLRNNALLAGPAAEAPVELPDAGLMLVRLARYEDVLREQEGELRADRLPAVWDQGLAPTLESLWTSFLRVDSWNPANGWVGVPAAANPYPSAYLLTLLLLGQLPNGDWLQPRTAEAWLRTHHPFWSQTADGKKAPAESSLGMDRFLLGFALPLRLVQAARDTEAGWWVRLSALGRALLGLGDIPTPPPTYPKTLLVQPNLEIIAYRQGLTPGLVAQLSQFAAWKSLGSACTLQLGPESVYRALEAGWTFDAIIRALEQYGMRPTPDSVVESLRTWANKRERLTVYPSAALLEFATTQELDDALARGVPAVRIADRLAVVPNESGIDYRHFKLTASRDFVAPPDRCVAVEGDGVTLTVDGAKSDLLLETELRRFTEDLYRPGSNGHRQYRLTPTSLARGRETGWGLNALEEWFPQRTGKPLPPAARLLLTGPEVPALEARLQMVVHVSSAEIADGLEQWPGTRDLVEDRLGPTALVIRQENLAAFKEQTALLGLQIQS